MYLRDAIIRLIFFDDIRKKQKLNKRTFNENLQAQIGQPGMIFRAGSQWPVILPVCLLDRQVVDARKTPLHLAVWGKLPVLVAIRAEPVTGIVVPLVREADSDAVVGIRPDFFYQTVVDSFAHFRRRNAIISWRPWTNSARLRQKLSGV